MFSLLRKILCALHPFLNLNFSNHWYFDYPHSFLFHRMLCRWDCSIFPLKLASFHKVTCIYFSSIYHDLIAHYLFVLNDIPWSECTIYILDSSGWFYILTIMNKAATNSSVQIFVWTHVFNFSGNRVINELYSKSIFNFIRNHQNVFRNVKKCIRAFWLHTIMDFIFIWAHTFNIL